MHHQIRTSIGVLMFITVPASIGIMALAQPLFTVFYGYDPIVLGHDPNHDGSRLLFYYAPVAILISLLSVTASMLQGIDKQKLTVYVILASVVIKLALNYPLIMLFHTPGAILSTSIALLFAIGCNFYILKNTRNLNLAIAGFISQNILILIYYDVRCRSSILHCEPILRANKTWIFNYYHFRRNSWYSNLRYNYD